MNAAAPSNAAQLRAWLVGQLKRWFVEGCPVDGGAARVQFRIGVLAAMQGRRRDDVMSELLREAEALAAGEAS